MSTGSYHAQAIIIIVSNNNMYIAIYSGFVTVINCQHVIIKMLAAHSHESLMT